MDFWNSVLKAKAKKSGKTRNKRYQIGLESPQTPLGYAFALLLYVCIEKICATTRTRLKINDI